MLGVLYQTLARTRRRWYAARPDARRRLDRPVVSVGALTVGGSGKTPVAAVVARALLELGESPAILSRGYGRARRPPGVVVVSERGDVKAGVDVSGDEPLMLARRVTGASVLVAADRHLAGRLAESQLGATVHVLDDGFQHFQLERDVEVLVVGKGDLDETSLPFGRLREPLDVADGVDAVVVEAETEVEATRVAQAIRPAELFRLVRRLAPPRPAACSPPEVVLPGGRVLAFAGIARPDSFVEALRAAGYDVVDVMRFADHHRYTPRDLARVADRARALAVDRVLTTEKDMARLGDETGFAFPLWWVPLEVTVEPAPRFHEWLGQQLAAARRRRRADTVHDTGRPPEQAGERRG